MEIAARGYDNPDLLWSPEILRGRLGQSGLAIIDTRPAEMFAKGRIPGARHFDLYFINCDDTDSAPLASFPNYLPRRYVEPTESFSRLRGPWEVDGEDTHLCLRGSLFGFSIRLFR